MTVKLPRVWILGAGFSKPLGGPLIHDLLASRELLMLSSLFPEGKYRDRAGAQYLVRRFYAYGHERRYWDHAEQFLDLVESAASEVKPRHAPGPDAPSSELRPRSHGATLLESLLREVGTQHHHTSGKLFDSIDDLALAGRRALAVDCSVFLRSAQLDSERWQPHKDWANSLTGHDTVVTFNYDHVPELLSRYLDGQLRVIDPMNAAQEIERAKEEDKATVLKVHGSVTWVPDGQGDQMRIRVLSLDDPAIGNPEDVVIGVPGPGKREVYRKRLDQIRKAARDAISNAARIVFVGYRFPPTDGDARKDILGAIGKLQMPGTEIETVLGPKVAGDDSMRLLHLLRSVTKATVTPVPLYAEDYFSMMHLSEDGFA